MTLLDPARATGSACAASGSVSEVCTENSAAATAASTGGLEGSGPLDGAALAAERLGRRGSCTQSRRYPLG